jgi:magnesium-transporting ATPase (P-type)
MKIKEMFKKITAGIGAFFLTVTSKVFGLNYLDIQPEYGIELQDKPAHSTPLILSILNILQFITLPVVLILGLIVIIKKLKRQEVRKLKIAFITSIIVFVVICVIKFIAILSQYRY